MQRGRDGWMAQRSLTASACSGATRATGLRRVADQQQPTVGPTSQPSGRPAAAGAPAAAAAVEEEEEGNSSNSSSSTIVHPLTVDQRGGGEQPSRISVTVLLRVLH